VGHIERIQGVIGTENAKRVVAVGAVLVTAISMAIGMSSAPAYANLTRSEYREVGVSIRAGARLSLDAVVTDDKGRQLALGKLINQPSVFVFADYTCRALCGPILSLAGAALEQSGLVAGRDYRLIVMGLDPKDTDADARAMRAHLGDDVALQHATTFVTADAATIKRVTAALGYRYRYDAGNDQFAHPAAVYVLGAGGAVVRTLAGLGLTGESMRLALVDAGKGKVGTFRDQVRLLCYGFDPAHGTYNLAVSRLLVVASATTLLGLGGGIGFLLLAGRKPSPPQRNPVGVGGMPAQEPRRRRRDERGRQR
jgi:protein SCO1/2